MLTSLLLAGLAATQPVPTPAAPATDSRGIAVESAPATAPAGTNIPAPSDPTALVVPSPNQEAAFATTTAIADVPACSKTVTDHCKQTYEKQGR